AEYSDFPCLGMILPNSINVISGYERNQSVGRADVRDSPTPLDLTTTVLKGIGNVVIGSYQPSRGSRSKQPPLRILSIDVKRAGKDFFLIHENIQRQLSGEGFYRLGITGIKDAIAPVERRGRLSLRSRLVC